MGTDIRSLRLQEQESTDLRLSDLHRWQKALEVPLTELVVDTEEPLSRPVLDRARLIRVMKTAVAIHENSASSPGLKRMAETLVEQLVEIMPELKTSVRGIPTGSVAASKNMAASWNAGYPTTPSKRASTTIELCAQGGKHDNAVSWRVGCARRSKATFHVCHGLERDGATTRRDRPPFQPVLKCTLRADPKSASVLLTACHRGSWFAWRRFRWQTVKHGLTRIDKFPLPRTAVPDRHSAS